MKRSFLLLDVLAGLALLALIGVWLLKTQMYAVQQFHGAERQRAIAARVEKLLWTWSETKVAVTLPSTGEWEDGLRWRRTVEPVRIMEDLIATHVTLSVLEKSPVDGELFRVDWIVPPKRARSRT